MAPSLSIAFTNSSAERNRSRGSLASARTRARSMRGGMSARATRTGTGVVLTCIAMVLRSPGPRSGGSPASISYTTQPRP